MHDSIADAHRVKALHARRDWRGRIWRFFDGAQGWLLVAIIGLLLGPIYPAATTVMSRLLPRSLQNTAIAFVSSAGSSGGAIAPFVTGILAQSSGTWVLHPVCVGLVVLMQVTWFGLGGDGRKRRE